jgi:hypothetical protein
VLGAAGRIEHAHGPTNQNAGTDRHTFAFGSGANVDSDAHANPCANRYSDIDGDTYVDAYANCYANRNPDQDPHPNQNADRYCDANAGGLPL